MGTMRFSLVAGVFAVVGSLIPVFAAASAAPEKSPRLRFASGFLISPDYHDVIRSIYDDYSIVGGYGFLDLQAGLQVGVSDRLRVFAGVDGYVNYFTGDLVFVNAIAAPSVSCQFLCKPHAGSPFIKPGLNWNTAYSGSKTMEWDGGGFGYELLAGYKFADGGEFEFGYISLPVRIFRGNEVDFGGVVIRYRYEI